MIPARVFFIFQPEVSTAAEYGSLPNISLIQSQQARIMDLMLDRRKKKLSYG